MPLPTFARDHRPHPICLRIARESQTIATMNAPATCDPPGGSARDSSSDSDFPPPALARAYGDALATDLPRGVPGRATASEVAMAFVRAFALRIPDLTGSAPELFTSLVDHGLLPSLPSARVIPAALALLASVSPLVEQRSARRWTIWLARAPRGADRARRRGRPSRCRRRRHGRRTLRGRADDGRARVGDQDGRLGRHRAGSPVSAVRARVRSVRLGRLRGRGGSGVQGHEVRA